MKKLEFFKNVDGKKVFCTITYHLNCASVEFYLSRRKGQTIRADAGEITSKGAWVCVPTTGMIRACEVMEAAWAMANPRVHVDFYSSSADVTKELSRTLA